ncbi:hypothetical protein SAMN04487976_102245 [Xaviernesmea oryzae]|nr:hypothetical protein SAMN04487976_102245 [Xaviernesmea oryzae]
MSPDRENSLADAAKAAVPLEWRPLPNQSLCAMLGEQLMAQIIRVDSKRQWRWRIVQCDGGEYCDFECATCLDQAKTAVQARIDAWFRSTGLIHIADRIERSE